SARSGSRSNILATVCCKGGSPTGRASIDAARPRGMTAVWIGIGLGLAAVACLVWGWVEAGWRRVPPPPRPLPRAGPRPPALRVAPLSDLHLGIPSRGERAVRQAFAWVAERRPDLVVVSGDLVSQRGGEQLLHELVGRLPRCYAILGNHDVRVSRDPFSRAVE